MRRLRLATLVLTLLLWPLFAGCLSDATSQDDAPGVEPELLPDPPATLHLLCEKGRSNETAPDGYTFSLEGSYLPPDEDGRRHCWAHLGHHHYFVGANYTFALLGGEGRIFYVEQVGFSPSADAPHPGDDEKVLTTPVPVEVSLDGLVWTPVALLDHVVVSASTGSWDTIRQAIEFTFEADGEPFRFIRVRAPESIYTGLSGFLDHSRMLLQVEALAPHGGADTRQVAERHLDCQSHIMERFLEDSPCTFGGYVHEEWAPVGIEPRVGNLFGQWDAPSFFHTYPLAGTAWLDRVRGEVEVRDYRNNIAPASREIWVQTSMDGRDWTTAHNFTVTKVPQDPLSGRSESGLYRGAFEATDLGLDAAFVRLVAEPMETWFDRAPNRHPWAFFLHSEISLGGRLPE